jgi:hypothetical protein
MKMPTRGRSGAPSLSAILLTILAHSAAAQEAVLQAQGYLRSAHAAYREADYLRYARDLQQALALNPASMVTRYNLASAYALTGRIVEALQLLEELARARVDFGMAHDPDFEALHGERRFVALLDDLERKLVPVSNSRRLITIEQNDIVPEGIAFDSASGRTFISSMRTGDIHVVDRAGRHAIFASIDDSRALSAIGMTVDLERNMLWCVGTSLELAAGFDRDAPASAGLFGFDIDTGSLQRKVMADPSSGALNDVAVAPNGDLYLSGTTLSVLSNRSDSITPLETGTSIAGSNGITIPPDGGRLYVSSYPVGIAVVELASGTVRFLEAPEHVSLYGVDGLYWYEGDLIGVQNGLAPWRIMRMDLDAEATAVSVQLIEFANEGLTPTTGAIVGDEFHYVGSGPAPAAAAGSAAELAPLLGATIVMSATLK